MFYNSTTDARSMDLLREDSYDAATVVASSNNERSQGFGNLTFNISADDYYHAHDDQERLSVHISDGTANATIATDAVEAESKDCYCHAQRPAHNRGDQLRIIIVLVLCCVFMFVEIIGRL